MLDVTLNSFLIFLFGQLQNIYRTDSKAQPQLHYPLSTQENHKKGTYNGATTSSLTAYLNPADVINAHLKIVAHNSLTDKAPQNELKGHNLTSSLCV